MESLWPVPDEESQECEDEEAREMQDLVLREDFMVWDCVCGQEAEAGE